LIAAELNTTFHKGKPVRVGEKLGGVVRSDKFDSKEKQKDAA